MKTKSNSQFKALLTLISMLGALVFFASVILHIAPLNMLKSIIDFSTHHYFLIGFLGLVILLISVKLYNTMDEEFEKQFHTKNGINYIRKEKSKRFASLKNKINTHTNNLKTKFIEKEQITSLKFPDSEVLTSNEEIVERNNNLMKAMTLGNSIKHKVKIHFKDVYNHNYVETTVWYANSKHIALKGGIIIPIKSIYKVEF